MNEKKQVTNKPKSAVAPVQVPEAVALSAELLDRENTYRRVTALDLAVKAYHETDSRPTIEDILKVAATFDKFLRGEK